MHGLDVIGAAPALGISWGDVGDAGKAAFPYVHATGKGIATAFGAGQAAQSLENVEIKQGWLPATPSSSTTSVTAAVDNIATTATPKLHPGVSPKTTSSSSSTKATALTPTGGKPASPSKQQSQLSTTTIVVGAGVLGIIALILRRLWGA